MSKKKVKAVVPRAETREISAPRLQDKYSTYPSNGLTPYRLAAIFKEADDGDIMRQAELFEEMEEKDPHLFSQLQTRKNAVTGLDWEIIAFDQEDERDKEIAEFVTNELLAIEGFENIMLDLLDAIGKGISVSEIIWKYDEGKTTVSDIKRRHQKQFFWDNEDVFKVMTKDEPTGIPLIQNKYMVHTYKAKSGHPARAGVLRVVAWMYLFKNYDVKDWVSFAEIYGMPLRLGKYNPSASPEDKRALMEALVQIGTDAAGIIPDGTEIDFKEAAKVSSLNVYESLARYCDEQISKAVLGQTLTSDSGGGSYAQSKTHNEVRHDLTVADCKSLAATIRRDLIRPLVYFNFGESKRIPTLRFDCEETGDLKETSEVYKTLICDINLPVPLSHLYKKFSIPKPENNEEIAKPTTQVAGFEEIQNKESLEQLSCKGVSGHKGIVEAQKDIDLMADAALKESNGMFEQMFEPLIQIVNQAASLDDVRTKIESDATVLQICKDMQVSGLEELLQKAMFLADLRGRQIEDG